MTDPAKRMNIGATTIILPSTARFVHLLKTLTSATMTLEENGVDYIVPVSKKLWILKTNLYDVDSNVSCYIKKHTVVDTDAGTQIEDMEYKFISGIVSFDHDVSVEAGKYINFHASDLGVIVNLFGVELDA